MAEGWDKVFKDPKRFINNMDRSGDGDNNAPKRITPTTIVKEFNIEDYMHVSVSNGGVRFTFYAMYMDFTHQEFWDLLEFIKTEVDGVRWNDVMVDISENYYVSYWCEEELCTLTITNTNNDMEFHLNFDDLTNFVHVIHEIYDAIESIITQ